MVALETGDIDRLAIYEDVGPISATPGSSYIDYNYTVQEGDFSKDLDYNATNSLYWTLPSGWVLSTSDENPYYCLLSAPNSANSLAGTGEIVVVGVPQSVVYMMPITEDGRYREGREITVAAVFAYPVVYAGSPPSLNLDIGGITREAAYWRGNNTNTLYFNYTVQVGDDTGDLGYDGTGALTGTITNRSSNPVVLTLPSVDTLAGLGDIDIYTPATVLSVTSPNASHTYGPGSTIHVNVTFAAPVTVTGATPLLELATGGDGTNATYASGNGTRSLVFEYTVAQGDESADLDYAGTAALALNGGSISDRVGAAAGLDLPLPGSGLLASGQIVVDTTPARVSSVSSSSASGTYGIGRMIDIDVVFDKAVTVTGTPHIELETGDTDRDAPYSLGSSTTSLRFIYTVQEGDSAAVLNYKAGSLDLNGGTITAVDNNPATVTLPAPGSGLLASGQIVVDGIRPEVASVSSPGTGGPYKADDTITVSVTFSEAVTVDTTSGRPSIELDMDATNRNATYDSGTGGTTLVFRYTVQEGDSAADLGYTDRSALSLNGGTIRDAAGNDLSTANALAEPGTSGSLSHSSAIVVDTAPPRIVGVTSTDADGTYGTGAEISITVRFSEPVAFSPHDTRPELELDTGNANADHRHAVCTPAESASDELACTYTVRRGDATADLGYGSGTGLELQGATATDGAGNDLLAGLPDSPENSLSGTSNIALDTAVPEVLRVGSPDANITYGRGDTIRVNVVFNGTVSIEPAPQAGGPSAPVLHLETGENDRTAVYAGGSGGSTLGFEYTVMAGDFSADLNYTGTGALTLGAGARLVDEYGNEERNPALPDPASANSLGGQSDIEIRTVPTVDRVSANYTAGTFLKVGQTLGVRVEFSEKVFVAPAANGSVPSIGLDTGRGVEGRADYSSGSGTHILLFAYPVHPDDSKAVLDYNGTGALKLNGATLRGVGANASLTLPAPGSAGSLASANIELRPNEPPAIDQPGNRTVGAGVMLSVGITAVDPEGQPITFSLLDPVPNGASIDAPTGLFTWTPTEAQRTARGADNSTYVIAVLASDPHMANGTVRFAVTVVEPPPEGYEGPSVAAIPDMTGREGERIRFVVNVTDGHGPFGYSLAVDADPRPPAGAAVHPNGTFSWEPRYDQEGTHPITVVVDDRFGLSGSRAFAVTVLDAEPPGNLPPVIEPIDPRNADEGTTLVIDVNATDPDAGNAPSPRITYSLAGSPPAGAVIDPDTGVFTWVIRYDAAGTHNITVSAADQYNRTSSLSFAVTVADVDAPNEPPEIGPIPEQRVTAGTALALQVNATDPNEGDILVFDLADPPPGAVITTGGLFTWTPGRGDLGRNILNVTVTDDRGLLDWAPLNVTVDDLRANAVAAQAVFAGPGTVRIDYEAPLGPPAGHTGAVYGNVTIGGGDGAALAAPASVSGLGTRTHIVVLDGDAAAGRGQNGTIALLADLEGVVNGTLYAFTADSIPVGAGEDARTLSPPGSAAPVAAIERDGFVRAVDATAAGDGARPAINVTGLAGGDGAQGQGAVIMPDDNVTIIASFAEVAFPPNAVATSVPSDGLLELYVSPRPPTAEDVARAFGAADDAAAAVRVLLVVEVGDNATRIEFDMPVRILLRGQANGSAFYVDGAAGGVVPVRDPCGYDDDAAAVHARLGGSGECWLDSGGDKVIYTYHLTRFGAASVPASMCSATLSRQGIDFASIEAGSASGPVAQEVWRAYNSLRLAEVSIEAGNWTIAGGSGSGGFAMPANATQVRAGGAGEWAPLEGAFTAALEADRQSASVQFRVAVPADAFAGAASGVSVLQTVTYTVECEAPPAG